MNKKKVALVLSTGGARGLGHIGVIEELMCQGYKISSLSGCSIGALIGAAYITGNMERCKDFLLKLNRLKMLQLIDFSISPKGFIKGSRIMKIIGEIIPDINMEDLPIPFTIIATDISNNKEIIFESGSLHDAIRASISLPMIFQPFENDGVLCMDGGIINPLPLNRVRRTDNDLLVAVIAGGNNLLEVETSDVRHKWTKYSLLLESITMLVQKIIQYSIQQFKPDIIIYVPNKKYGIAEFYRASEIIERGKIVTREVLTNIII